MKNTMERMISKDLGMRIEDIRHSTWNELENRPRNILEKPFRPKDAFVVGGNINLAQGREMGTTMVNLRGILRKAKHDIGCLMKNRRNV